MPHPRFDPLGRRWVLLAPERARRGLPDRPPDQPDPAPCDFCAGREDHTPPETAAVRDPDTAADAPGWLVRVVPNLYPATDVHEVVVHTPDHGIRYEELPPEHRSAIWRTYRGRVGAADVTCPVLAFNRGTAAGASRSHEHAQLFGLGLVPPTVAREAEAFAADEPCVLCRLRDDEGLRVARHGPVDALVHPVPLVAHELLIVPPCDPHLAEASDGELGGVAEAVADALRRTRELLGDGVPTNLVVHTSPRGTEAFHWHAHLLPRTATWGALELGAELPIVAADPPRTAEALRRT